MKAVMGLFLSLTVAGLPLVAEALQDNTALTHVHHIATSFPGAPEARGLAVTIAGEANTAMLHANFAAGDLGNVDAMKTHVRHVLHALDPEQEGEGPGLGFGVRPAAEAIIVHIELAMNTPSASDAVLTHGARVAGAGRATVARVERMIEVARQALAAESAADVARQVEVLRELALQLDTGEGQENPGIVNLEDGVYSILIGERLLRVLR